MATAKPAAGKSSARTFIPAQVVNTGPGRWRVDGHDAKRNTRRFFNSLAEAQMFANQLNTAPRTAAAPSGAKFGGALRGIIDGANTLKAKQAATAKAKADQAAKASVNQFAALHTQQAVAGLEALTSISSRDSVVAAIKQAEAAKLPQARVEAMLKSRGFDQNRLAGMVKGLQADTAKA